MGVLTFLRQRGQVREHRVQRHCLHPLEALGLPEVAAVNTADGGVQLDEALRQVQDGSRLTRKPTLRHSTCERLHSECVRERFE